MERAEALQLAAGNPLNGTAIGVTVTVLSNPLRPGAQRIEVTVDPHDLQFSQLSGKWHADFDLVLTQRSPDGRTLSGQRNQCVVERATYNETQAKKVTFRRDIPIRDESASLRVLVRDAARGTVGSVDVPIAVAGKK